MSRLLGHLTKQKRQKRKDVRAARTVKSQCQTLPELWIAPNKQFCLQPSLECRQRWRRSDVGGHTRSAATGNAQSPTVNRRVTGTTSVLVDAQRRHRRASRSLILIDWCIKQRLLPLDCRSSQVVYILGLLAPAHW